MSATPESNAHTYIRISYPPSDSCTPRGFHLALIEPSDSSKSPFHRGQPRNCLGGVRRVPCCLSNIYERAPSSTPELHLKSHQLHHSHLNMAAGASNTCARGRRGGGVSICWNNWDYTSGGGGSEGCIAAGAVFNMLL